MTNFLTEFIIHALSVKTLIMVDLLFFYFHSTISDSNGSVPASLIIISEMCGLLALSSTKCTCIPINEEESSVFLWIDSEQVQLCRFLSTELTSKC